MVARLTVEQIAQIADANERAAAICRALKYDPLILKGFPDASTAVNYVEGRAEGRIDPPGSRRAAAIRARELAADLKATPVEEIKRFAAARWQADGGLRAEFGGDSSAWQSYCLAVFAGRIGAGAAEAELFESFAAWRQRGA